jgi:hypothetical protein
MTPKLTLPALFSNFGWIAPGPLERLVCAAPLRLSSPAP